MFDPFRDYESAGYLRNRDKEKDLEIVKQQEHAFFLSNLEEALMYLKRRREIQYKDFLAVHGILFKEFYPSWAGQDRTAVAPVFVSKGAVQFEHPDRCRLAVEHGLRMGTDPVKMKSKPGEVMGAFAWAHPFLDGNGRTMLLVHHELCARADFSIDWAATQKDSYLRALTDEITSPGKVLDEYLRLHVRDRDPRMNWAKSLGRLSGLDGTASQADSASSISDNEAAKLYENFEQSRGYEMQDAKPMTLPKP